MVKRGFVLFSKRRCNETGTDELREENRVTTSVSKFGPFGGLQCSDAEIAEGVKEGHFNNIRLFKEVFHSS